MSKWTDDFRAKTVPASEAVKCIHSGDRVVIAFALGAPLDLIDAMVANREAYRDVEIVHMLPYGRMPYLGEEMLPHFHTNTGFVSPNARKAVRERIIDFSPAHFSEFPKLLRTALKPRVLLCQGTYPDADGYVSLGMNSDYTMPAARVADIVIMEINHNVPRVGGDTRLHVSDIHRFVESERTLESLPTTPLGDKEKAIGAACADLIKDGDILQIGIGAIPDAVLSFLGDKRHLGVHSEVIADGVQHLVEQGVIDGSTKKLNKGKVVATGLFGTPAFHKFVNNNPLVELYPVDYTNDVRVISQQDNIVSINSCIQVDLLGQVCSEIIGGSQYSGIGGQGDFGRGANLAEGGRTILACYSTAKNDTISRIVPRLDDDACVTTQRCDVQYIVTEHGVAYLKGRPIAERAKALIDIAHPDFRDELMEVYERKFARRFMVATPSC